MADGTTTFLEELPNSVVPTTIGGMLAEEWTINPHSPIPSFLERVFMQEAHDSSYSGCETAFDVLVQYCGRLVQSLRQHQYQHPRSHHDQHQADQPSGTAENNITTRLLDRSRQLLRLFLQRVNTFLRRYKLQILFLSIYAMERASLERSSCSVAESFYGGHRVKLSRSKDGKTRNATPLETKDKVRLAAFLALSFYVKRKLEYLYQLWRGNEQFLPMEHRIFLMSYPWIRFVNRSVSFLCRWNYLLGLSLFFDVPSLILQQWVRRVSQEDSVENIPTAPSSVGKVQVNPSNLVQSLSIATSVSAAISWLTWCRSTWSDLSRQHYKLETTIPPPPPPAAAAATATLSSTIKPGHCCLCGAHPPERPTACTVSGFVGCGHCMEDYLKKYSICPVTKQRCLPDSFVRLFEPRS